jgi:ferredoxin
MGDRRYGSRFLVNASPATSRFDPIGRWRITREAGCINCGKCADLCLYDVHFRDPDDPRRMADPVYDFCRNCFMCIQGCPKGVLTMDPNPAFLSLGDALYPGSVIAGLMRQAVAGEIPVQGCGYGGPFSGPGFDSMWTDMSEIVRPTRDGIHGREYISTAVDLGRKPADVRDLEFDEHGDPLTNIPATIEIKLPILFDRLPFAPPDGAILQSVVRAANELGTFAIIDRGRIPPGVSAEIDHVVELVDPRSLSWPDLVDLARRRSIVELRYTDDVASLSKSLKDINADLLVGVRIVADAGIEDRVEELARADVDIIHLHLPVYPDTGSRPSYEAWPPAPPARAFDTLADAIPRAHNRLIDVNLRDQVSLVASGDITYAERVPKAIVLGADAVAVDVPLLVALECTVCGECQRRPSCPRDVHTIDPVWGTQRIVNMMASWHNQLLEILGAMGLREVSRLRGEIGRAMKKDDLDREIFATIFAPPEAAPSLTAAGGGESEDRMPHETGGKRR